MSTNTETGTGPPARESVAARLHALRNSEEAQPKPQPTAKQATPVRGLTAMDIEAARKGERARLVEVYQNPASRGRERMAADMLAYQPLSAGEIIKHLAAMPTDSETERRRGDHKQQRAASRWDKVFAKEGKQDG